MNYCRKIHLHKSKFYDIMYIDEQVSYNKKDTFEVDVRRFPNVGTSETGL